METRLRVRRAVPSAAALVAPTLGAVAPAVPATAGGAVTLRHFGHAFFLVTSGEGVRVALDPFTDIGYPMPEVEAEVVTISHEAPDHNNLTLIRGIPEVLRGLAERLKPAIAIPIPYKTAATAGALMADERPFLAGKPRVRRVGSTIQLRRASLPRETEIWAMDYR